jgi:hypothetical protein
MGRTFHVCLSVEGALRNWTKKDWKLLADANEISLGHAKKWMELQKQLGRRVIPIGEMCEGFSYETGCPGHKNEEEI